MNPSIASTDRANEKPRGSSFFQTLMHSFTKITDRITRARKTRATYTALRDLDDHMLRDIGLSRADVADLQNFGREK